MRTPRPPAAPGRGFTLLEVMVSMAILALGLVTAFEVVGGALENHVRAHRIELATLLARGKLADAESKFQEDGFRDFDQTEEGDFSDEGHPEIHWTVVAAKPTVELGAEGVVRALTGVEGGLPGLLAMAGGGLPGDQAGSQGGGQTGPTSGPGALAQSPLAGPAMALIQQQLTVLGEEIKKGVREVRLTVAWPEGRRTESLTVVTHLVILGSAADRTQAAAQQKAQDRINTLLNPPKPPAPPAGGQP